MTNKATAFILARVVPINTKDSIEEHELKLHLWQQHEGGACFKMDKRDALDLYSKLGEVLDIDKQEDSIRQATKELKLETSRMFDEFRMIHGEQKVLARQAANFLERETGQLITRMYLKHHHRTR